MTAKLGKEGATLAAPKALTASDPDEAAEAMLYGTSHGGVLAAWRANAWVLERRFKRPVPPHTASDF